MQAVKAFRVGLASQDCQRVGVNEAENAHATDENDG
jgi:hypothetical protein